MNILKNKRIVQYFVSGHFPAVCLMFHPLKINLYWQRSQYAKLGFHITIITTVILFSTNNLTNLKGKFFRTLYELQMHVIDLKSNGSF